MGNKICTSNEKKQNDFPEHSFEEPLKNEKEMNGKKLSRERNKQYKHNNLIKSDVLNDLDSIFLIP